MALTGRLGVIEKIVDGQAGIIGGAAALNALVVGVSSIVPAAHEPLGKDSDFKTIFGEGPLVDALTDLFSKAGQAPSVAAKAVAGADSNYFTDLVHTGAGPEAVLSGVPVENADIVLEISTIGGPLGTADYKISTDGGVTFGGDVVTPVDGIISIGTTGMTITLDAGTHVVGDQYTTTIRIAIGDVVKTGTGPDITAAGTPVKAANVVLQIISGGALNVATYQLSIDGGDTFGVVKTIPVGGVIAIENTGVSFTVPGAPDTVTGDQYTLVLLAPSASIATILAAIDTPLETLDPEFIYIVGETDSVDWASIGAKQDGLFSAHKFIWFLTESRLPRAGETLSTWSTDLAADMGAFSHNYIAVVAAHGEIAEASGLSRFRNWGGLFAGREIANSIVTHPGKVQDGQIGGVTQETDLNDTIQAALKDARFVTSKTYAGLSGVFWGDDKTTADVSSDYQNITTVRIAFKALRLGRTAALQSMFDELGDPTTGEDAPGIQRLKNRVDAALESMRSAKPKELVRFVVSIPPGQDILNNGLDFSITLIDTPYIKKLQLFLASVFAGTAADPANQ